MKHSFTLLVGLLLQLAGCTNELTTSELDHYLANPANGLTRKQEAGELTVEVTYRPAALVAPYHREDKLLDRHQSQYYLLSISRKGAEVLDPARGFSAYSSLLQTLAFRPQEYMRLTTADGDTLVPSNSILERTYGMGASTRILVAFPASAGEKHPSVVFHLEEFGLQMGNLSFPFEHQDIVDIPPLKPTATMAGTPK
ncbi:hypothetical protein [Hymenobacter elongatus]|uniref:Uncharacterized protein n=1 Tax=Hymenobacter elongatus TaxID=877208 RepID=A0A4Z0PNV3_9BACT|nr:hypothetical protein [Hymenobacter elongatus]TGE17544.1 hypothetical protein E5J99_06740 [Hymenobacter elongatus]